MEEHDKVRRQLLITAGLAPTIAILPGCRASLPRLNASTSTADATALLERSAVAHGAPALESIYDVNVAYAGKWHYLVAKMQPDLVDAGFRGGSEERVLLRDQIIAQSHTGPKGRKHVVRIEAGQDTGQTRVWFNDQESHAAVKLQAAALVADGYSLFLLGPLWIVSQWKNRRQMVLELAGTEQVADGNRRYTCDLLGIRMRPGLGVSEGDQLVVYIDRESHLMRRVRFTLEGLESTRGALVEVDTFGSVSINGVQWPTRFHERLLRPGPLKVHDWRLTGLDVNRGYTVEEVSGKAFTGAAGAAAAALPGANPG